MIDFNLNNVKILFSRKMVVITSDVSKLKKELGGFKWIK